MNNQEEKTFIAMMNLKRIMDKYQEIYGEHWRKVFDEDKENDCFMKID